MTAEEIYKELSQYGLKVNDDPISKRLKEIKSLEERIRALEQKVDKLSKVDAIGVILDSQQSSVGKIG